MCLLLLARSSLYSKAFAAAIRVELCSYRRTILRAERDLLDDPHLSFVHVGNLIRPHGLLLPSMVSAMDDALNLGLSGGKLLSTVFALSQHGNPRIQRCWQRCGEWQILVLALFKVHCWI